MRRLALLATLVFCVALAHNSSAVAQEQGCSPTVWHDLDDVSLKTFGVVQQFRVFEKSLRVTVGTQLRPSPVEMVATDCPVYWDDIRADKLPIEKGRYDYHVYISVGYLRRRAVADITRDGRQWGCRMLTDFTSQGVIPIIQYDQPLSPQAKQCMLLNARVVGDSEYAKWLARGVPPVTISAQVH